jgi:hypothetical protein
VEENRSHRRRPRALITDRDRLILEMAAEHRLILAAQVQALLGIAPSTASSRLRALSSSGYLSARRVFAGHPTLHQITRSGLEVLGSRLPRPRLDLRAYDHDIGLGWLWLAARTGTFGPLSTVVSERTMRSQDGRREGAQHPSPDGPMGVRLGGTGPRGHERLHYPDLLLVTPDGRRIAVELELSAKGSLRREKILAGYGSDPRIDAVLYLVDQPGVARAIQASARRLGISHHVHVQWVRQPEDRRAGQDRALQRAPLLTTGGREHG